MGELERGGGIPVHEHLLRTGGLGAVLGDEDIKRVRQCCEAVGQLVDSAGLDLAICEVGQAVALGPDDSPAGRGERGVEAEDNQPSRSITASLIS
jgi:hypothetical protein